MEDDFMVAWWLRSVCQAGGFNRFAFPLNSFEKLFEPLG